MKLKAWVISYPMYPGNRRPDPHDRRIHEGQAVRGDVSYPWQRQQADGSGDGADLPRGGYYGVEAASETSRQAGLHFPEGAVDGLCGRMLLARLSKVLPCTQGQPEVLGDQDHSES